MSSKKKSAAEDHCSNTETDEGTAARLKKRSRRVSFAEITSVHVFDRDDDSEAPSNPTTSKDENNNEEWEKFNRDLGFVDGDDDLQNQDQRDDDGDEAEEGGFFFRPNESPASTAGSANSNDEDLFFGPVSASFIRPGRLSDSGASDIHDITMDSTAFSQHFRSLAKSDSGIDLKTPTGFHLSFEENTPSQNTIPGSNLGSSMLLNSKKKPISPLSTSVENLSGGSDSNDMSLVQGNSNKYDYGRLSFGWEEALLAEGVKDLHTDDYISSPVHHPTSISTDEPNGSLDLLNKGILSTEEPNASETCPKADSQIVKYGSLENEESEIPRLNVLSQQFNESPPAKPLSSLSKRSRTVFQRARLFNTLPTSTPQNHVLSVTDGFKRRADTVPSVQKSISKLKMIDASPFASDLNFKMKSVLISSNSLYRTPPFSTSLLRNIEDAEIKHVDASAARRDQSQFISQEKGDTDNLSVMKLRSGAISENFIDGSFSTGTAGIYKFGNSPAPRSTDVVAREQSSGLARVRSLVSQLTWSGNKTKMNLLTSEDLTGKTNVTPGRDLVFTKMAPDHENITKPVHSLEESVVIKPVSVNSPVSKRIREEVMPGTSECVEEIYRLERSPKIHKSVGCGTEVLSVHHNESKLENKISLRQWTDILSEFLVKNMFPPSTDKLSLQGIGELEDRLVKLQRLQTYEMHCKIIQSQLVLAYLLKPTSYIFITQKTVQDLANLQHQRTAEAKSLLLRVLHEHARLQLLRVKQEKMQKNVQLLRDGIQEARLLKLNSLPHISAGCSRDVNTNASHFQSIYIRSKEKEEVSGNKVTELRQSRDTLESKITSLMKSVHSSCKLEGSLSHSDTVSTVKGCLKKKERCMSLRSNLQLWKVHKIFTLNGDRNLVLNYLDFVTQRITFKAGSASSLVILNELNDDAITKSFPNIDASTALSFTFNAMATQKYVGSPSLAQETQITSSVLGNLVDVAEEVQHARFELQNLMHTRFVSPSVGQLDLCFHFIGMKSGRKVALTLDMSCLKWGLYPSDIVPYKLEGSSVLSREESFPEQLSSEIRSAVQSLDFGFWRLLRICRTISQVVQSWSP